MQGARFWVDADREVNIRVKEGLITENGGPGKAKVRHGDYALTWKAECVRCPARQAQRNGTPFHSPDPPILCVGDNPAKGDS
jgi:hypothetical protein